MRPLTVLSIVGLTICGLACVNTSVMDTGRSLPAGERQVTNCFAGGMGNGAVVAYDPPGAPETAGGEAFTNQEYVGEWMSRYSWGLGNGLQADVALTAPMPILGLGMALGMKWQLPFTQYGPFALAITGSGGGNFGGYGNAAQSLLMALAHADAGVLASLHFGDTTAIYTAPRIRSDVLYHRGRASNSDESQSATARGISLSTALGFALPHDEGTRFFEAVFLYSPHAEMDDGWRITIGIGLRRDNLWASLPF